MAGISNTSFRALFELYYAPLCRRLTALTGDPVLAEDIVQESFLRLYLSLPPDLSNPGAWLNRVAVNLAYNELKRARRRGPLEALAAGKGQAAPADPVEEVERRDEVERVRVALNRLTPRERFALLLRHSGYSYAEIAAAIHIAPTSVGTILARAQRNFRAVYLDEEG